MSDEKLFCTTGTSKLMASAPLSLRDQIALIVLVEKLKNNKTYHEEFLAKGCYSIADAMLRARGQ